MNNKTIGAIVISLLIGAGLGVAITKAYTPMSHNKSSMHAVMEGMNHGLVNKTGNEFDKAFISEMIVHHQGAINMANMALSKAGHQEIKDLAKAIISAQESEIKQMDQWHQSWFK